MHYGARRGSLLFLFYPQLRVIKDSTSRQTGGIWVAQKHPCVTHAKRGGQLGRSRMKTDDTTLAAGYGTIEGFNLRQLIRHLLAKDITLLG